MYRERGKLRQCRLHASVGNPGISAGGVKGNNAMRGTFESWDTEGKAGGNFDGSWWFRGWMESFWNRTGIGFNELTLGNRIENLYISFSCEGWK